MKNLPIFIIALAMIISAIILGSYFYNARKEVNTVRVVGYAAGEYDSDILKWRLTLSVVTSGTNQMQGFQALTRNISMFRDFLNNMNFDTSNLEISPSINWPMHSTVGQITGYQFQQQIAFTLRDTTRFHEIENLVFDMTPLIATGISINNSSIEYYISQLPEAKLEIISEATNDAKERALIVANTTNTRLGKLLNGRVGVFQITEPLSAEVGSMGIFNTSTRRKQIAVTFTGVFELK